MARRGRERGGARMRRTVAKVMDALNAVRVIIYFLSFNYKLPSWFYNRLNHARVGFIE